MLKLGFSTLLFLFLLFLSLITYPFSLIASSVLLFMSALVLGIDLIFFLYRSKAKMVGKIKIEEVSFARIFVFRSFFKPKDLWIVYDSNEKKFRPADFRDLPLKVGMTFIIGLLFLYVSYLIFSNIFFFPEVFLPRLLVFIILVVIGFYDFFVSTARFVALMNNKNKKVADALNKNRSLKNFIRRQKAYVEVTPNLTLNGSVTSVEIITKKKFDTKRMEKLLLNISRKIR
jgi:uncharacterized protein YacL